MSSDQMPYISKDPAFMRTPAMMVTVLDANRQKIMEYHGLPGLILEKYACGPDTYTEINGTEKSITVYVKSNKTHNVIQIHIGVYQARESSSW